VIENRQNRIKKIFSVVLTMILLVLMNWCLHENKEIFSSLNNLDISDILMIAFLQAITVGIVALITSFALGGVSYLTLNSRLLKNTKELTLS